MTGTELILVWFISFAMYIIGVGGLSTLFCLAMVTLCGKDIKVKS